MLKVTTIKTEHDAWQALERWVKNQPAELIEFSDWPRLRIKINGKGYNSTLKSGQMAALLDFKMIMGRGFSAIAHGAYDARRLRSDEEEQLELTTKVEKGSSISDTDLTPLINAIAQITTANPQASIGAALVLGLAFVARPIILKHFENKTKQLQNNSKTIDADERGALVKLIETITSSDREKMVLLDNAISKLGVQYPHFSQFVPDASSAFWRLAGSAANAEKMEISGIPLSHEQLDALSERRGYRDVEVDEVTTEFSIVGVIKVHRNYRVQLKSRTLQISAVYSAPQMTDLKVKKLLTCLAASTPIHATVEIKTIDKSQVIGRLLSFQPKKSIDAKTA